MKEIPVWDRFVRVFHWTLVSAIFLDLFVLEEGMRWHRWVGYIATGLVLVRIVWGFVGTPYARFRSFLCSPFHAFTYIPALIKGRAERHLGHSPAGAWMIFALMAVIIFLGVSGWLASLAAYRGNDLLEESHSMAAYFLEILIVFHLLGVLGASIRFKENLVRAMISGKKRAE